MYDCIIIGAGPAAYSAAIYLNRYRSNVIILGEQLGGMAATAHLVENYPGFSSISGMDLMEKFKEHAEHFKIEIKMETAKDIKKQNNKFTVTTSEGTYEGLSVLIATGTAKRKLNIPGEDEFLGKGVSYCATCDGAFFKNKKIAVVGGNDSAVTAALLLAEFGNDVFIIYRGDALRAMPSWVEQANNNPKIKTILKANIKEIKGDKLVKKIILDNGKQMDIEGVFIEVGSVPTKVLTENLGVKTDKTGYIDVNAAQETNIEGVYAAGDITNASNNFRQIITAASEGAIASLSIFQYVNQKKAKK